MTETAVAEKPKRRQQGSYTQEEITRALVEVAACSGNSNAAARNLAADEDAPNVPQQTLWAWSRRERVEEYERIRQEALPAITQQAAEQHMDLAVRQSEASAEALDEIKARLPRMEDKDLVNAMGKLDIGSGIHTEKAQLLSGQPTHRVEKSAADVLRGLEGKGLVLGEKVEEETKDKRVVTERVAAVSSEPVS